MSEIGRHSARDKVRYKRSQTTAARRKRSLIVLSAVGAALLVGIAVVIVVLATGGSGKYTRVPEIEGLTYNKAKAELKKANLDIRVDPTQDVANLKIDKKKVGYQHPVKGANAEKGSVVTVALLEVPSKGEDAQSKASTAPASTPAAQPEATPAPAPEPAPAPRHPPPHPRQTQASPPRWKATRSTPSQRTAPSPADTGSRVPRTTRTLALRATTAASTRESISIRPRVGARPSTL